MHAPTTEQQECLRLFAAGEDLKIKAYAGSGKTTTLEMLARSTTARGLYLAFNKAIADSASSRFPATVQCKTAHSLALGQQRELFDLPKDKTFGSMTPRALMSEMDCKGCMFDKQSQLTDFEMAGIALAAVKEFCQSDAPTLTPMATVEALLKFQRLAAACNELRENHRSAYEEARAAGKDRPLAETEWERLVKNIHPLVERIWARMMDLGDDFPMGHDGYLKRWALARPRLSKFDYIVLDESQDTNPVLLGVLAAQTGTQRVYVGDPYQQIYAWRGAVDAMTKLPATAEARITGSFRFGGQIAEIGNFWLRLLGSPADLKGLAPDPGKVEKYGKSDMIEADDLKKADAVLCRTNSGVLGVIDEIRTVGRRPAIVAQQKRELEDLVDDIQKLMLGQDVKRLATPELRDYTNWNSVVTDSGNEHAVALAKLVKLVDRLRVDGLRRLIESTDVLPLGGHPSAGQTAIMTGHRAKGLEWPSVIIWDDFVSPIPSDDEMARKVEVSADEARLLYVACTRARQALRVPIHIFQPRKDDA